MSNALVTLSSSLSLIAPLNKKGEITRATAKAVRLLSENKAAIVGAALHGSGAVGAVARATLHGIVPTVDSMLSRPAIDGSAWGVLLALMVADAGMANYNEVTHRGKSGCIAFAQLCVDEARVIRARAETDKQVARADAKLTDAIYRAAQVNSLVLVAEQARIEADAMAQEAASVDVPEFIESTYPATV